ncbi:MAG: SpoIIE family protein phosphatase [Bacteroidia bacterium]|nr:SpoIIE family protein phosphatase [Bacteroidia bacterium]
MDISLCILHPDLTLEYSGANNPLWVLRPGSSLALKGTPSREGTPFRAGEEGEGNYRETTSEDGHYTITEIKADKQPIGKYTLMTPFKSHTIKLEKGDQVYTFTDGFPDQFGGEKLKKYMSKRLKKFLFTIADQPMETQKELLLKEFDDWRQDTEQVDDVCVIGVKI